MKALSESFNKKNIRFVALGNSQIKFFTLGNEEYLSVTGSSPENPNTIEIPLESLTSKDELAGEYHFKYKRRKATIEIRGNEVKLCEYLWMVPYKWYKGTVSDVGKGVLYAELGKLI
jgi:hypothetical protein